MVIGLAVFGTYVFLTRGGGPGGGGSTFFPDSPSSTLLPTLVKTDVSSDISVLNIVDKAKDFVCNSSMPAAGSLLSNENYGVLTKQIQNIDSDLLKSSESLDLTAKLFGSFQDGLHVLNFVSLLKLKSLLEVTNSKLKVLRSKFSSELDSCPNLPVDTVSVTTDNSNILYKGIDVDTYRSIKLPCYADTENVGADFLKAATKALEEIASGKLF